MEKVLKLYTYVDGVNDIPFPSEDKQVVASNFRGDYKRMGGAPSITCSVKHELCLDGLWTYNVYAMFNGERFFIKQIPSSSYDNTDSRYKHDIELVSERIVLDNVYVYDVVDSSSSNDKPVSNSSNFTFFGDIHEFVGRLNESLKYSKVGYSIVVDSGIVSEAKQVSFQDQFFSNAIQECYNTYKLPYYFSGKVIHVGYTNNAITHTFKYGQDESLLSIQKQNANFKIVNRVTGVGSADNIPYYYPNEYESKQEVEANGGTWVNPQTNLMPPIYRESYGSERFYNALNNTYIDSSTKLYYEFENEFNESNPREHIVNFEDIKPSIVGITNASGERIDAFSAFAFDREDNDDVDEEGNYIHPYFFAKLRKFDGEFGFNLFDHAIDESEMVISMTSGSCGACEFTIMVDEDTQKNTVQVDASGVLLRDEKGNVKFGVPQEHQNDTRSNEVWIALKKDINTFGIIMPNASNIYYPQRGDTFVILHIDLPKSYIVAAENKLMDELIKYMAFNNSEKFNFTISFSRIFFAEHPEVLSKLNENARIQIEYDDKLYELYVSSFTYSMDSNVSLPDIRVELTDTLTITRNAIQTAIDNIKGDMFSSYGNGDFLKQGLRYFIRKDVDDRSRGNIASDKGFEVGRFVSGMIGGSGAKLYQDKNKKTILEVDNIIGRESLIVPTITFNTIEVVSGDKANTFAYGRIKNVEILDELTGVIDLDLLSDEYGTVQVFDILRGVFHNINGGNESTTREDHNKFLQYSGFFTSYFYPTQITINKAGEMQFRYRLQEGDNETPMCPHPCKGMNFFAYGNFNDPDRQSITYENRSYKRRLVDMNRWDINPSKNIAMQDGDLNGLVIGGFEMSGYGTFQTNSYFTGVQIQFTPEQLENIKGEDSYSVELSSYEGLLKVDADGKITSGMTSIYNVVSGGMNVVTKDENVVTTDFNLKTTIQAARGNKQLYYSTEIKSGTYIASLRTVGCSGYILNGVVIITDITNLEECYVVITINCEGRYSVEKEYRINAVYDGKKYEIETIYSKLAKPNKPEDVHPYIDNDEWNHTIHDENMWMATSTKDKDKWSPWILMPLKGYEYKVLPENTTIGKSLTGAYSPSSVRLTCCRVAAGYRAEVKANWSLERYDGVDWNLTDFSATDTSYVDFNQFNEEYKSYRFTAYPVEEENLSAVGLLTVVSDGKNGQIARYRGTYKEGETYVWDDFYRDIMIYKGNAYQVKSFNTIIIATSSVPNLDEWNQANQFDFVAMNTALIDNANIAGFTFTVVGYDSDGNPLGRLESSNKNIILDSYNETITATNGIFKGDLFGKTISFDSLPVNSNGNYQLPKINGRTGMFYMDNVIGLSRSVSTKRFDAASGDSIIRITGASDAEESSSVMITNQQTIILYSINGTYGDFWAATILPYWIFGDEPEDSMVDNGLSLTSKRPVQNKVVTEKFSEIEKKLGSQIKKVSSYPPEDGVEPNVLYVITD